jgi:hypothetical protein
VFCNLDIEFRGYKFTASGPRDFVEDNRDWFMNEVAEAETAGDSPQETSEAT